MRRRGPNLSLRGPIPTYFEGTFGLRGCVAWVLCASVSVTAGINSAGFYLSEEGRMADEAALLQATSAGVAKDGSTYVVLRWEAVDDAVGYNLYRSVEGEPHARVAADQRQHADHPAHVRHARCANSSRRTPPEWRALAQGSRRRRSDAARRRVRARQPGGAFERGLTPERCGWSARPRRPTSRWGTRPVSPTPTRT